MKSHMTEFGLQRHLSIEQDWEIGSKSLPMLMWSLGSRIEPYFLYTVMPGDFWSIRAFANFVHDLRLGFRLSLIRTKVPCHSDIQHNITEELIGLYTHLAEHLSPELPVDKFARFAEWDLRKRKLIACGSCQNYFAIDHNGNVSSCQMRLDRKFGSLKSEPLADIVMRIRSDNEFRPLAVPTSKQGACTRCEYYHVCAGGCPQHTKMALMTTDAPSPWCMVYGGLLPHYIDAVARQSYRRACDALAKKAVHTQ